MSQNTPQDPIRKDRLRMPALALVAVLALAAPAPRAVAADHLRSEAAPESKPIRGLQFAQVEKVHMVMIPATVTDKKGKNVLDLSAEDFTLYDEDRPGRSSSSRPRPTRRSRWPSC